jgi:hypothetical protein
MIAEIEKYIEIQNNIDQILKDSPFKISYIIEKTGIKKTTFFKKMKEKRFTSEELLSIAKVMEPVYRNETHEEILESLKRAEEDIENGRTVSFREFLAEKRKNLIQPKNDKSRNN